MIIDVSAQPGSDASGKLNACVSQVMAAGGGICDARGFGGTAQTISATVSGGSPDIPVTFLFDAATDFVPASGSTIMFGLVDGMSIEGTLVADVTGQPGWNGAVIASASTIPQTGKATVTHVNRVVCRGWGNSTGDCVRFAAQSGDRVSFVDVGAVQVEGMEYGIHLSANETLAGTYAWVNGNWFHNLTCIGTKSCARLESLNGTLTTTQISENHFEGFKPELNSIPGLMALSIFVSGQGVAEHNDFSDMTIFDAHAGDTVINLSAGSRRNQISGHLCLAACGDNFVTDEGVANRITDWSNDGMIGTYFPVMTLNADRQGWLTSGTSGVELGISDGNDLRILSGNGGLRVFAGAGTDHSLYLQSLDNSPDSIKFNVPLEFPNNSPLATQTTTQTQSGNGTSVTTTVFDGGGGFTRLVAKADTTEQNADINAVVLYDVPQDQAGMYRVSCYTVVTEADTVSSTLPACRVSWTDLDSGVMTNSIWITNTSTQNTGGLTSESGSLQINASANSTIAFSTAGYTSNAPGGMHYAAHIKLEYLGQ